MNLRNIVNWFAEKMLIQLEINEIRYIEGWTNRPNNLLLAGIASEFSELLMAVEEGNKQHIIEQAADVACYAMMLADNTQKGLEVDG
jgi:NTP pyrophosphatase (non-canonical NTP hydrolase)